jgi:hypothetical protein
MTGKAPSNELRTHQPRQREIAAVLAGVALALAVAAGVGAWQFTRDNEPAQTTTQAQPPATAAPAVDAVPAPVPATTVQRRRVHYIVSSQEQADRIRAGLDEADQIVAAMGQQPTQLIDAVFEVVTTPEEEARFWQFVSDEHHWRRDLGEPDMQVVDLRTPADVTP